MVHEMSSQHGSHAHSPHGTHSNKWHFKPSSVSPNSLNREHVKHDTVAHLLADDPSSETLPPLFPFASMYRLRQQISAQLIRTHSAERGLAEANQQVGLLEGVNRSLRTDLDSIRYELASLLAGQHGEQSKVPTRETVRDVALKSAEVTIEHLKVQLNTILADEEKRQTRQTVADLQNIIDGMQQEMDRLNTHVTQAAILYDQRGNELIKIQELMATHKNEHTGEMQHMAQLLTAIKVQHANLEEQYNQLSLAMQDKHDECVKLESALDGAHASITDLVEAVQQKDEQLVSARATIQALQDEQRQNELNMLNRKDENDPFSSVSGDRAAHYIKSLEEMHAQERLKLLQKIDEANDRAQELKTKLDQEIRANKQLAMQIVTDTPGSSQHAGGWDDMQAELDVMHSEDLERSPSFPNSTPKNTISEIIDHTPTNPQSSPTPNTIEIESEGEPPTNSHHPTPDSTPNVCRTLTFNSPFSTQSAHRIHPPLTDSPTSIYAAQTPIADKTGDTQEEMTPTNVSTPFTTPHQSHTILSPINNIKGVDTAVLEMLQEECQRLKDLVSRLMEDREELTRKHKAEKQEMLNHYVKLKTHYSKYKVQLRELLLKGFRQTNVEPN